MDQMMRTYSTKRENDPGIANVDYHKTRAARRQQHLPCIGLTPVEIVGAAPCYVHLSGVPGVPQFVARMQPKAIMRSEDALDEVPLADRDTHWLNSPSRDGKTIWETSPFLLVGAGAWDTDVASFPEPAMARYGRVGAPGSPWWVMVKRSE